MTYEAQLNDRDDARLESLLGVIRGFLVQASSISHKLRDAEFQTRDEMHDTRVHELGYVVQFISVMCPAHLQLIGELAIMLNDIDRQRSESSPHGKGKEAH